MAREWGICPKCKKPTKITAAGPSMQTLAYYPPTYDENGNNINPDRNITTHRWTCLKCGTEFTEKSGLGIKRI